jgi:hypothetical protein
VESDLLAPRCALCDDATLNRLCLHPLTSQPDEAFLVDVLADAPKAMIPLTEALGRMRSTLESDLRSSSRGVYRAVS